jgi:hypothetical protein
MQHRLLMLSQHAWHAHHAHQLSKSLSIFYNTVEETCYRETPLLRLKIANKEACGERAPAPQPSWCMSAYWLLYLLDADAVGLLAPALLMGATCAAGMPLTC